MYFVHFRRLGNKHWPWWMAGANRPITGVLFLAKETQRSLGRQRKYWPRRCSTWVPFLHWHYPAERKRGGCLLLGTAFILQFPCLAGWTCLLWEAVWGQIISPLFHRWPQQPHPSKSSTWPLFHTLALAFASSVCPLNPAHTLLSSLLLRASGLNHLGWIMLLSTSLNSTKSEHL